MSEKKNTHYEVAEPNPEYLIKSIAEQGYTLETSIADLMDNSISANAKKVEILINTEKIPFTLFIADDGEGMSKEELKKSMNFPSSSIDEVRNPTDLGRFGLGLKTASFAQTRCFTVISKKPNQNKYNGRTWDVNKLKGKWQVIVNSDEEINRILLAYGKLSQDFLNPHSDFNPNTIVIWYGLYKYETDEGINDKSSTLQKELTETTKEYLQLIFHRFMESNKPLKIRLNNEQLKPFNPFPSSARNISSHEKLLMKNKLRLQGFILPNRSIKESKEVSEWTLTHKGLMDMEGIYVYRANRIIVFGGWNGLIKKSPRLQLARLKVEIGNGIDHLFHLNVAKSSIAIPFGEKFAFIRYVSELKAEAEKEFYNYGPRDPVSSKVQNTIFNKIPTSQGMVLQVNKDFPLLKSLFESLNHDQAKQLKIALRMITTIVNKIKKVYSEESYIDLIEQNQLNDEDIKKMIRLFLESGLTKENIINEIIPSMGINHISLPASIRNSLEKNTL